MAATFFDGLSADVGERVLPYLSPSPGLRLWRNAFEVEDALSLMEPAHPLSKIARTSFTELRAKSAADVVEWVIMNGKNLTTLPLRRMERVVDPVIRRAMLRGLEARCISLRNVDIFGISDVDFARRILRATSGRLHQLKADDGRHAPAVKEHCNGLKELVLVSRVIDHSFLQTVGPTLTVLDIWSIGEARDPSRTSSKKLVELMRSFCPKLCDVSVRIHLDETTAFAELLCSYGEQLLFMNAEQLAAEMRGKVEAACPRVQHKGTRALRPFVRALGSPVRTLSVAVYGRVDADELGLETHAFSEIEELDLDLEFSEAADGDAIKGLFMCPKPLFSKVYLWVTGFGDKALYQLAMHVGSFRNLSYFGSLRDEHLLESFAENAPLLETVKFSFFNHDSDDGSEDPDRSVAQCVHAVQAFTSCPNLRELRVMLNDELIDEHGWKVEMYFPPLVLKAVRCSIECWCMSPELFSAVHYLLFRLLSLESFAIYFYNRGLRFVFV